MKNPEQNYTELLHKYNELLIKLKRKNYRISASRLILFLLVVIILIFIRSYGLDFILLTVFTALIPFLFLVKINTKNTAKIKHVKELIRINTNELSACNGNYSVFPSGKEYINYEHPFTYDLDIFGQESIYQSMNRSCTKGGADTLAKYLQNPIQNEKIILERQKAVSELTVKNDWRQNFMATGNTVLENDNEESKSTSWFSVKSSMFKTGSSFYNEIMDWVNSDYYFSEIKILPVLLIVLPLIALTALFFTIFGSFPFMGLVFVVMLMLSVVGFFTKKINDVHARIGRKVAILNKYGKLLKCVENENFTSVYLSQIIKDTKTGENPASEELKSLKKLAKALDNRLNFIFILFADGFLLWDLYIVLRLEKWRKKNKENILKWFHTIYEFDALNGLAAFAYNNPDFVMPKVASGNFFMEIKQGGHPLLDDKIRINNDFSVNGYSQIRIITGANMAGKSTFLRTVGVNLILAMAGSVVCAREFTFVPIFLQTSVRTNDSLQKHESYFFAELKRLKSIIERLDKGEKLFVIIDEMLRGTNSKDKHLGSAALIERLIHLKASGLVATHDIELGKMNEIYPQNIENYRFEVDIKDNELYFDYKIKSGISQNLNAIFLMKKMGIVK